MTSITTEALRSTETAQTAGPTPVSGSAPKTAQIQSTVKRSFTSPRKTDEDFKGFARRMIRAYGRRAADADPWVLGDLAEIQKEMDGVILTTVVALRKNGYSWELIGEGFGLSKQATFNRYGKAVKAILDAEVSA